MKKCYILLIVLLVLCGACNRSQFSTTTRHYKNGKVCYTNQYGIDRNKISKVTSPRSHLNNTDEQKKLPVLDRAGAQNLPEPEITTINPAPISENKNLIASTSNEPTIIAINENQISYVYPDTNKSITPPKGTTNDSITYQVIKFKDGHKEEVRIIYQSHDTLKYELISEQGVVRSVMMEKVDTILQVKSYSGKEKKEKVVDTREIEPLGKVGFIFSFLGFLPVIGIPFALLAIVFGAVSLHKLHRHPEKYRGKKRAIASLILGILAIVGYGILTIMLLLGGGGVGVSL